MTDLDTRCGEDLVASKLASIDSMQQVVAEVLADMRRARDILSKIVDEYDDTCDIDDNGRGCKTDIAAFIPECTKVINALTAKGREMTALFLVDAGPITVPCPECGGLGEYDRGPLSARWSGQIDPEYEAVTCPECEGTGRVAVEAYYADELEDLDERCGGPSGGVAR